MFMISRAFSYSSSSSFQQTVVYLCSVKVSSSSIRLAEVLRGNNVRKRRNAVVFFNVLKNFLRYAFKKSVFANF